MHTRYVLVAILAFTAAALSSLNGVHAQAGKAAPATPATSAAVVRVPVAGQAVLGVTVAEERLIAAGFRASKLLKQEVYNDKGEKIGKIDDLIVAPDGTLSIAVVNVGGFLGVAKHLVAIPVRQFEHIAPKAVLPNASKDQLKALPPFQYVA